MRLSNSRYAIGSDPFSYVLAYSIKKKMLVDLIDSSLLAVTKCFCEFLVSVWNGLQFLFRRLQSWYFLIGQCSIREAMKKASQYSSPKLSSLMYATISI